MGLKKRHPRSSEHTSDPDLGFWCHSPVKNKTGLLEETADSKTGMGNIQAESRTSYKMGSDKHNTRGL